MRKTLLTLVPCVLAGTVAAQTTATVTLTVSNMVFTQSALSATSNSYVAASLRALGAASANNLFSSWWWYRLPGDTQEWSFRNDAPNAPTRVVAAPTITTTWPNVRGLGKISAVLVDTLVSTGVSSGYLRRSMTVTNLDALNPITIDMFAYADLDTAGSCCPNNGFGDNRSHYVDRTGFTGGGEFFCPDADAHQVSVWLTTTPGALPFVLSNTTVDNLSGAWSAHPFSGDYNGAYQWTRTIAAGGSETFTAYLGITSSGCMPLSSAYGSACNGGLGAPVNSQNRMAMIETGGIPRSFDIRLSNAPALAPTFLLAGFAPASIPFGGLTIQVDLTLVFNFFMFTGAGGTAALNIGMPNDPSICGVSLYTQWIIADATSTCTTNATHTGGLQSRVGGWQ